MEEQIEISDNHQKRSEVLPRQDAEDYWMTLISPYIDLVNSPSFLFVEDFP